MCVDGFFFLKKTNVFDKCCFHTVAVDSGDLHLVFIRWRKKNKNIAKINRDLSRKLVLGFQKQPARDERLFELAGLCLNTFRGCFGRRFRLLLA